MDYSVQVVQPNIFLEKGCSYRFSFDAWTNAERTIKPAITAPNVGWKRYFPDTKTTITPERKNYAFDFVMTEKDDPAARIEFNLGNQGSNADVYMSNVVVEKLRNGLKKRKQGLFYQTATIFIMAVSRKEKIEQNTGLLKTRWREPQ